MWYDMNSINVSIKEDVKATEWSWTNKSQFTATKKDLDLRDTVKHKWHQKWPSRPTSSDAGSVDGHHHRFGTLQKEKVYLYSYF